jgi:hypothetical protein
MHSQTSSIFPMRESGADVVRRNSASLSMFWVVFLLGEVFTFSVAKKKSVQVLFEDYFLEK